MKKITQGVAGILASGVLVVSTAPAMQAALAAEPSEAAGVDATNATRIDTEAVSAVETNTQETVTNIQGVFNWNQDSVVDNTTLKKVLYQSAAHLCGSSAESANVLVDLSGSNSIEKDTQIEGIEYIEVRGNVNNAFTASVEEFSQKAPIKKIMGCTCYGNPADGRASVNAAVSGFKLAALVEEAEPAADANTITFVSSDGYKVSLPLSYVMQRYSIIVTNINDESAVDAVGSANQLWLGNTSARSFARDIVAIEITSEANPPAAPGVSDDANLPNVGVTGGGSML